MQSFTTTSVESIRQQDRRNTVDRQLLEQKSLEDLKLLAEVKKVIVQPEDDRFTIIDHLLRAIDMEARQIERAERKLDKLRREADKKRDIQLAKERDALIRSKNSGFSREVSDALGKCIARARKTSVLNLANSKSGLQSPFRFKHIPPVVFQTFKVRRESSHDKLKQLWLTNNQLVEVSPELRFVKTLEVLCLSGNKITKLPASIGGLKRLQKLFLNNNDIEFLPEQLENLQKLTDLHLDHNRLQGFSMTLTKLQSLQRLSLCHNKIRQLPTEIRRLQNLVELNVDHNRIGPTLPKNLTRLAANLRILGISHNCLTALPSWIDELELAILRAEGNRSADYVIVHPTTDLIVPDVCIPRRLCDNFLQIKEGSSYLPGYIKEAADYTIENARWYDDSSLAKMHQLLRTRAEITRQQNALRKRHKSRLNNASITLGR